VQTCGNPDALLEHGESVNVTTAIFVRWSDLTQRGTANHVIQKRAKRRLCDRHHIRRHSRCFHGTPASHNQLTSDLTPTPIQLPSLLALVSPTPSSHPLTTLHIVPAQNPCPCLCQIPRARIHGVVPHHLGTARSSSCLHTHHSLHGLAHHTKASPIVFC